MIIYVNITTKKKTSKELTSTLLRKTGRLKNTVLENNFIQTNFIPKLFLRLLWFFRRTAALFRQIRTLPQLFRFCSDLGNPGIRQIVRESMLNADGSLMGRTNLDKFVW